MQEKNSHLLFRNILTQRPGAPQGDVHDDLRSCANDNGIVSNKASFLLEQPPGDVHDDVQGSDGDDDCIVGENECLPVKTNDSSTQKNWSMRESLSYSPIDAPLLFGKSSRRQRCGCCPCRGSVDVSSSSGSSSRDHLDPSDFLGVDIKYDMWVMPVMKLMELEAMEPHQVLIAKGSILRWRPSMEGRIIFISHQWLGLSSPDPDCIHLLTLQRVLERLMKGEIAEVRTYYKRREFGIDLSVKAEDWVAALPHMYIWLDYFSMPQVSVTAPLDVLQIESLSHDHMLNGSLSVSYAVTWAEAIGRSPGKSDLPLRHSFTDHTEIESSMPLNQTDHRYKRSCNATDLQNAVFSIPAYVQLSSLMIVLAPMCRHHDTSFAADYSSWRTRGWCRMELASACLSPHNLPMMLVLGAEHHPVFMRTFDAMTLPPGEGHFSCCALNHIVGNATIPCDKKRVLEVMESLISCKVAQLEEDGNCMFASLRGQFLRGLDGVEKTRRPSLVSLKELHGSVLSKGSRLLLQLALQFDSIDLVRDVLDSYKVDLNAFGIEEPLLGIMEMPPLSNAMCFASPDVVRELLDRRADATIKIKKGSAISRGFEAFHMALIAGREDNVRAWLEYFPDWLMNKVANGQDKLGLFGVRMMHIAACGFSLKTDASMIRCMVDARASVNDRSNLGGTPLFMACQAPRSTEEVVKELLAQRADVNFVSFPQTKFLKRINWLCRKACKVGEPENEKVYLAMMSGATALHIATLNGKLRNIELLVEANADVSHRNTMGLTALDVAAWIYKEVPQPVLDLLS